MSARQVTYTLSLKDHFSAKTRNAVKSTNNLNRAVNRVQRSLNKLNGATAAIKTASVGINRTSASVAKVGAVAKTSKISVGSLNASLRVTQQRLSAIHAKESLARGMGAIPFAGGGFSRRGSRGRMQAGANIGRGLGSGIGGRIGTGLGMATMGGLGGVAAGGVLGGILFEQKVIESLTNYEYFSASLRTLMQGDIGVAKNLEQKLITFAAETPFGLLQIQDATKRLLAYGFTAKEITPALQRMGDVSSALKIPLGDIAYLYGTTKTQGRVYARDIWQFTNRGVPIIKELTKQFGVNEAKLKEMVSAGEVGFPQIEKAFISMTSEGGVFFEMMKTQSLTVGGRIEKLGDEWEQLAVNIGLQQSGILKSTISWASDMVSSMKEGLVNENWFEGALKDAGIEQFTWYEKLFGMQDVFQKKSVYWQNYAAGMSDKKEGTLHKGILHAVRSFNAFGTKLAKGEITKKAFDLEVAPIRKALKIMRGSRRTHRMKTDGSWNPDADTTGKGGESTSSGLTSVEARQPQIFNIDIEKFGEMTINTKNISESASNVKEQLTQALVEAVNNFQIIAAK